MSDGAGDSGPMCQILDSESWTPIPDVTRPRLGCGVRVGSIYARTMSAQDWWQCTPITEILEEREDYMKFKTRNSVYEWKMF
jgi:hypothetical protein